MPSSCPCICFVSQPPDAAHSVAISLLSPDSHSLQVLGNSSRREVYDIYGSEGLAAGLQVVPSGKNTEALKQEWEGFRAQQVMQAAPRYLSCLAALPCSPPRSRYHAASHSHTEYQMHHHAVSFEDSKDTPCTPLPGHKSSRNSLEQGLSLAALLSCRGSSRRSRTGASTASR